MKKRLFFTPETKIVYLSCHFSGAIKLAYLLEKGITVKSIITLSEKDAVLNKVAGYFNFIDVARKDNIDLYYAKSFDLRAEKDFEYFSKERFDLMLISGWQRIVPDRILTTLKIGAIGEHGSSEYLPRGRGRSPINWSIIQGRERFVIHIFMVTSNADSGKIIDRKAIHINSFDDVYTVYTKAALASGRLFVDKYREIIAGTWESLREAKVKPTYFPKRDEKDDFLNWSQETNMICNKIRAITHPYPGAKSKIGGDIIKIWKAQPYDFDLDDFDKKFGQVLKVFTDNSFVVKTIDGTILIRDYEYKKKIQEGDCLK